MKAWLRNKKGNLTVGPADGDTGYLVLASRDPTEIEQLTELADLAPSAETASMPGFTYGMSLTIGDLVALAAGDECEEEE